MTQPLDPVRGPAPRGIPRAVVLGGLSISTHQEGSEVHGENQKSGIHTEAALGDATAVSARVCRRRAGISPRSVILVAVPAGLETMLFLDDTGTFRPETS